MSALTNSELLSVEDEIEYIIIEEPRYIDTFLSYLVILTNAITSARTKSIGLSLMHEILLPE